MFLKMSVVLNDAHCPEKCFFKFLKKEKYTEFVLHAQRI